MEKVWKRWVYFSIIMLGYQYLVKLHEFSIILIELNRELFLIKHGMNSPLWYFKKAIIKSSVTSLHLTWVFHGYFSENSMKLEYSIVKSMKALEDECKSTERTSSQNTGISKYWWMICFKTFVLCFKATTLQFNILLTGFHI